jgi:hypothetical protein
MAGEPLGAHAPAFPHPPKLRLVPGRASRRRLNHGVVNVGAQLAAVYSTRTASSCYPVQLEVGAATLEVVHRLTAAQARALAKALNSAASAAELGGAA